MATLIDNSSTWATPAANNNKPTFAERITTWADGQASNRTLWFMISLIAQGVFFLPIPALLLFYFNAPIAVLAVTLGLFFSNIIAGMGGAGIRTLLGIFGFSVIAHILMVVAFTL